MQETHRDRENVRQVEEADDEEIMSVSSSHNDEKTNSYQD